MPGCTKERFTGCTKQKGAGYRKEKFEAAGRMKKSQKAGSHCYGMNTNLNNRRSSMKGKKKKGKKSKKSKKEKK